MNVIVYVDGLNLYYRALKGGPHKWLNIMSLAQTMLNPTDTVTSVKYYTTHVKGKPDPEAPKRQHAYLRALHTLPGVEIYYGRFIAKQKCRPLVEMLPLVHPRSDIQFVLVHDSEEKGSDVNLGAHLVWDGCTGKFDAAVVISEDTDLVEPIRIVTQELKKPVGLFCANGLPSKHLVNVTSFRRHINPSLLNANQLPNLIQDAKGKTIKKPDSW